MPLTAAAKNAMLDALGAVLTYVGILRADAGKSVTGVASTDTFTTTAHGYSNGDLVVLSGLTGGSGLTATRPYFVIGATTNTYQLSTTSGGSAVNFTTDLSAGTVTRLVELSGGSPAYARQRVTWNRAGDGTMDDASVAAAIDVPAGATTDYLGGYSASSAGTIYSVAPLSTVETFAGQGTYTVTDQDIDLLAGV